jgi:hypothetical protein
VERAVALTNAAAREKAGNLYLDDNYGGLTTVPFIAASSGPAIS